MGRIGRTPPPHLSKIEPELTEHTAKRVVAKAVEISRGYVDLAMIVRHVTLARKAAAGKSSARLIPTLELIAAMCIVAIWRIEIWFDGDTPPIPETDWKTQKEEWGIHWKPEPIELPDDIGYEVNDD